MSQAIAERCIYVMPTGRPGRYSMTPAQRRAYDVIVKFTDEHGRTPCLRNLVGRVATSTHRIFDLVSGLEERGWISFEYHEVSGYRASDSLRLVEPVMRFPRAA